MTEAKRRRHQNIFAALFVVGLVGLASVSVETEHVIQSKAALFLAVIFTGAHLWVAMKDRRRGHRRTQFEDDDYLHAVYSDEEMQMAGGAKRPERGTWLRATAFPSAILMVRQVIDRSGNVRQAKTGVLR